MTTAAYRKLLVQVFTFLLSLSLTNGFVLKPAAASRTVIGRQAKYDAYEDSHDESVARNRLRTDPRNFLTQRSIQSFVFLLDQCKEDHTVRWMEKLLEFKNIDGYHGTGAFSIKKFPSWNSLFLELVDRPAETVVVEVKRTRRRHRGWSYQHNYLDNLGKKKEQDATTENEPKDNPFLEEITVEYELDIDPVSLVNRIMSVREQISKEWERDLETMIRSNDEVLVSYADYQREARTASEEEEDDDDDDDEDLQDLTSPYSDRSEDKVMLFDKNAMVMLTNSIASQDRESSPFRRSNFDLLLLLSTQESIHRVLREYAGQDERMENFEWLREFYVNRVGKYFDGHGQGYGRADAFLEELLFFPPVLQKTRNGEVHLIDPMGMAEDIIRERSEVAREWKEMFADTPQAHIDMRRLLLTRRMMEITENTLAAAPVKKMFEDVGAFE